MNEESTLNLINNITNQKFEPTWYQTIGHFINNITFNAFDKIGLFNSYDSNKRDFAINQMGQLGDIISAANKGSKAATDWLQNEQIPYAQKLADEYGFSYQDNEGKNIIEMPRAISIDNPLSPFVGDFITYKDGYHKGQFPYEYSIIGRATPALKITDPKYSEFADKISDKLKNIRLEKAAHNLIYNTAANAQRLIEKNNADIFGKGNLN